MLSAGQLIWTSCRPLLRLVICTGFGFVVTKADLFPAVAAQGASQVLLNVTYPSLMFSKIVPAFSVSNIHSIAPILLVAVIYIFIGLFIGWAVKQLFWVPHRFRWGIIVAGGWANTGDIPTAVVVSIMSAAPFNGTEDENLSVAYISGFLLVGLMSFFILGGIRLVTQDFVGPDVEDEDVRAELKQRRREAWGVLRLSDKKSARPKEDDVAGDIEKGVAGAKHVSFMHDTTTRPLPTTHHSHVASTTAIDGEDTIAALSRPASPHPRNPTFSSPQNRFIAFLRAFLRNLMQPISASILVSFIIALAPPLKALFVADPGAEKWHIHPAPDGLPPLSFLLDTGAFIGGAAVPMGLICLGSALARLRVPSRLRDLPVGAIVGLSIGRLVVFPVLGVLITRGFVKVGVIDSGDKVLQFVCMFFSCLPTATTQVFVTQVASGTGSAEHLAPFLLPQYALMLVSMTALTAYSLQALF
ncbi:Auxin efflux carrier transmembrane protein [Mycena indigotica]|uniref:Auxin efflux carrier transmembrane protein n=1 Tax=Mycena indigotica TaxID=2126181 RepID=A0A8H6STL4_9AGAR|nr:Auxin efflux carrier transmembrane protein [Mycena indigotica]KAF7304137.1 Auxin efflux carrier transmembrane protein [Mycena indigotica]